MVLKIATWNVNSIRVRLPHVLDWLATHQPDILALQEIKQLDVDFPFEAFKTAGYVAHCSGQKSYNGVATLVRTETLTAPISNILTDIPNFQDPQRRVLGLTVGDLRILNVYVPNGESVTSQKYQYKLQWLEKLSAALATEFNQHSRMIILGDFNIAPSHVDVHDPVLWADKVICSQPERQAFNTLLQIGFNDCLAELYPNQAHFTWWDYRLNGFKRNLGLRIDHILASKVLFPACISCEVDKSPRGLERPSDHAPVIATFNIQ